ncbi:Antibiotic biosynthesis monooxygenase [uncultured Flavonifractor sp.]|jgi:quinol monooxygenase YgiN|nr:Antibiotic biosynthesis monooxygenase [uncultured Flavonifractor sp.]
MMLFQVTYTMLPGQRDAFLQMMRESGILDQIRREEGCLDYRYYLPEEEDGTLLLVERWTGPEAQKAHIATSHMARLGQVKAQYVAETSVVTWALD